MLSACTGQRSARDSRVVNDDVRATPRRSGLAEFIREQREQAHISLRQLAALAGVSNPYLSQVERGLRRPSAHVLQQIATGLRISAEQLYVRAGILDRQRPGSDVVAAILADPTLAERDKHALVEIYQSLRRGSAAPPEAAVRPVVPSGEE